MQTVRTPPNIPKSIGAKIDALFTLREKRRELEAQAEELKKDADFIELAVMEQMKAEGIESSRGVKATVSISKNIVPNVEDWDAFYKYILRNNWFHLLQKRPSVSGCQEIFEMKKRIPGVVPFEKETINLRKT